MARAKEPVEENEVVTEAPTELPAPDSIMAQLAKLGGELQAVAADKAAREGKLKEIEAVLGQLQIKDFPDLAESEIIQNFAQMFANMSGLGPGEAKNKGTLAEALREWTWADLKVFPLVKFYCAKEMTVTFNGLQLRLPANENVEVPSCFFDIYREHMEALKQAAINEQWLMGISDQPPHPNWQTPESAEVRAHSMQGQGRNLRSGFLGVGPIKQDEDGGNA